MRDCIIVAMSSEKIRDGIVIGNDGIVCYDGSKEFSVYNSKDYGQYIVIKGLPTQNDGLFYGQLYNDGGTLKINT